MNSRTHQFFARFFQLILVLIPAMEGTLAIMNNIQGGQNTLTNVIIPLLSMSNVQPEFMHSVRAITNPNLQVLFYYFMSCMEGTVGLLGVISLLKMLLCFNHDHSTFVQAQAWGRAACCLGVAVWGVGFFVLGGDFFLAWQNPTLSDLQTGGLNYALIMFISYVLMRAFQRSEY